jgi:hypothetical protein
LVLAAACSIVNSFPTPAAVFNGAVRNQAGDELEDDSLPT